jgi:arsenate reductase-like glutaredoxin family protein
MPKGLRVSYTEDGEAYVDEKELHQLTGPRDAKINQLEQALIQSQAASNQRAAAQETIDSILAQKDSYKTAHATVQKARTWINEVVSAYMAENGIQGSLTSSQVVDLLAGTEVEKEFHDEFGQVDLIDVVFADASKQQYQRALDSIDAVLEQKAKDTYARENLDGLLEQTSTEAILNLDDDAIEKLMEKARDGDMSS